MSQDKPRDPRKERFWRTMLRRWRRSGLSVRAFCRQHHLAEPNFYAWRRTLALRDAESVSFVPVDVIPDAAAPPPADPTAAGLELLLPGGRVLRLAPTFDGPTLLRLLALLEEGRS